MIKKVVSCYYAHKTNYQELLQYCDESDYNKVRDLCLQYFYVGGFQVIKYDKRNHKLSLIKSPDWDTAFEPTVGNALVYDLSNITTSYKVVKCKYNNPQIYHHKWSMVADDYTGFDINESKKRSNEWQSKVADPKIKSKIGYKNFWIQWCKENGLLY